MWKFDATASASSSSSTSTHGVIGSGSRFLWSRMAPEEEEREEEALPSYLSYLQPAFRHSTSGEFASSSSSSTLATSAFDGALRRQSLPAATGSMGLGHPVTTPPFVPAAQQQRMQAAATGRAYAPPQTPYYLSATTGSAATTASETASGQVEFKSREFAAALQDFIRAQVDQASSKQQHQLPPGLGATMNGTACNCDPLKARVSELELQLQTLQSQVTSLLNGGMGNTSHMHAAGVPPPPPPLPGTSVPVAQMAMGIPMALPQPPLPPGAQQPSPTSASQVAQMATGVASAMSDRVSTLEGRQSAFQSQLAQISKVLGVPVGKHGKNSQVKTLVQTLREEIDVKVATGAR